MRSRACELGWIALLVVACDDGHPSQGSMFRDRRPRLAAEPAPDPVPVPAPAPPDAPPPPRTDCLARGALTSLEADALTVRWCVDTDGDALEDRCHTIDRGSGRVIASDPVAAPAQPVPPLVSGLVDADYDGYADDVPSGAIDVCQAGTCATLRPRLASDDVVDRLRVREDGAHAALAISDPVGAAGHYEVWDLTRGRRTARIAPPPLRGGTFLFDVVFAGDAVVVLAEHHDTDLRRGAIHELDGRRRARLADGSERIIPGAITTVDDRVLAVAVLDDDDSTVVVVSQDLATGRVLREVRVADYANARLLPAGGERVALLHEAITPSVALVDLATGAVQELAPDACPP